MILIYALMKFTIQDATVLEVFD